MTFSLILNGSPAELDVGREGYLGFRNEVIDPGGLGKGLRIWRALKCAIAHKV